jgi:hypothetical protein
MQSCRHALHACRRVHVAQDDSARGDRGSGANGHAVDDRRPHANERPLPDVRVAAHVAAWIEHREGAHSHMVADEHTPRQDRPFADLRLGADDGKRPDGGTLAKLRRRGHMRAQVNHLARFPTRRGKPQPDLVPVPAHADDRGTPGRNGFNRHDRQPMNGRADPCAVSHLDQAGESDSALGRPVGHLGRETAGARDVEHTGHRRQPYRPRNPRAKVRRR